MTRRNSRSALVVALLMFGVAVALLALRNRSARQPAESVPAKQAATSVAPLLEEALAKQAAADTKHSQLVSLSEATGISCTISVSEDECLDMLSLFMRDVDLVNAVRTLRASGVAVRVSHPMFSDGSAAGYISESGSIFLYARRSADEYRKFLLR